MKTVTLVPKDAPQMPDTTKVFVSKLKFDEVKSNAKIQHKYNKNQENYNRQQYKSSSKLKNSDGNVSFDSFNSDISNKSKYGYMGDFNTKNNGNKEYQSKLGHQTKDDVSLEHENLIHNKGDDQLMATANNQHNKNSNAFYDYGNVVKTSKNNVNWKFDANTGIQSNQVNKVIDENIPDPDPSIQSKSKKPDSKRAKRSIHITNENTVMPNLITPVIVPGMQNQMIAATKGLNLVSRKLIKKIKENDDVKSINTKLSNKSLIEQKTDTNTPFKQSDSELVAKKEAITKFKKRNVELMEAQHIQ